MKLEYFNSLPTALNHYEREFNETMLRIGIETWSGSKTPHVESTSVAQKLSYIPRQFIESMRSTEADVRLHFWPGAGLYEPLFLRATPKRPVFVTYHDPIPLRKQFGYSSFAKTLASLIKRENLELLAHSRDAAVELSVLAPKLTVRSALHPIVTNQSFSQKDQCSVLVAGQYKSARNLALLQRLGPVLRDLGYTAKIMGRGWPQEIEGWEVESRFVSEEELEAALGAASAILLPYSHYFQSGILVRALEMATLTVTPRTSFAEDIFGVESELIVDDVNDVSEWVRAITYATSNPQISATSFSHYRSRVDSSWRRLLGH